MDPQNQIEPTCWLDPLPNRLTHLWMHLAKPERANLLHEVELYGVFESSMPETLIWIALDRALEHAWEKGTP